ncbi:substrate-binding periplasmic protein [Fluviispira multicolorata]|uniref:Transporter substrate-binding domain-containing protein n=1 Tax=Fluviispira multicolorata TaxID=2654512 RepID=A0A833N449_9BACT|nr:transporter substrate-binding domain-containing protein [Fluviispira multicolorata]KAB8031039.1 transporter substrate-binding domain-containing protein [Fluviispira multicolorata]
MKLLFLIICLANFNISYGANLTVKLSSLNWCPYVIENPDKNGVIQNIIEAAFYTQGYKIETNIMPWDSALSETKLGNYDAIFPADKTTERIKYFNFSAPIIRTSLVLITLKNSKIKYNKYDNLNMTYNELKQYRFGVIRGYAYEKNFDERKDLRKIISTDEQSNMRKLKLKEIDIALIDKNVALYFIQKNPNEFEDTFTILKPEIEISDLYMAFSKKALNSENKLKAFNKGLKEIKDNGLYDDILKKFQNP